MAETTKGHRQLSTRAPAHESGKSSAPTARTTSRKSASGTGNGRTICDFFPGRQVRSPTPTGAGNSQMEVPYGEKIDYHSASPTSFPDGHSGAPHTPGDLVQDPSTGSQMASSIGATACDKGRELELPPIRSTTEETAAHHQEANTNDSDVGYGSGTTRTGKGSIADSTVQMLEKGGRAPIQTDHSLATADHDEAAKTLGDFDDAGTFKCLGAHNVPPSPASISSQPPCRELGPSTAALIYRQEAGRACLSAQLANDGVICFVNANLLATAWSVIQLGEVEWPAFGHSAAGFQELLTSSAQPKFALEPEAFALLRDRWGIFGRQADSHEFLSVFLEWAQMPVVDVSWQSRLVIDDRLCVQDEGSRGTPPTLLAPQMEKSVHTLQSLLEEWHSYRGMQTCFVNDTPLLCMHVDHLLEHRRCNDPPLAGIQSDCCRHAQGARQCRPPTSRTQDGGGLLSHR